MIGFAQIAGGAPSSTKGMTAHLMNNTVSETQSRLAAYYARGGAPDSLMMDVAREVLEEGLPFSDAVDRLMSDYIRTGDLDTDSLDRAMERLSDRLLVIIDRMEEGLESAPLAVLRPDTDARVLIGLGIEADGLLSNHEINALLAGRRADGEPIEGKHYAPERRIKTDPKTGERKWATPIGAYDFCPTPDKSVSVAWAFAEPAERAMILAAHQDAARAAVAHIAEEVGRVRLGKGGQDGSEAGHVTWLEFTHHTSRRVQIVKDVDGARVVGDAGLSGDPDLHTHFLIPNAVFSAESDKVGSLDTMAIRGFIFKADAYYHAALAQNLREAGFEVVMDRKTGAARMPIVPEAVRELFSKRTKMGEMLAERYTTLQGEVWADLTDAQRQARIKVAVQSIEQKESGGKDDVADFAGWRQQALDAHGWDPRSLQLYGPPERTLEGEERTRVAYEMALPFIAEKLGHEAVIKHWDLQRAALHGLTHTGLDGLEDVKRVTDLMWKEGVIQYGETTALAVGQETDKRYISVTTRLHEDQENEFVRLGKAAAGDLSSRIPDALIRRTLRRSGLDFSDKHGKAQRRAIERLASGGRFGMMIAAAGAGKTAALKPLVAAWHEQGRDVWGTSLAWRQADDLTDAGIDRSRVKAVSVLLDGLEAARRVKPGDAVPPDAIMLTRQSVVAVDEWGLLGTRQALELMRHRDRVGFSVVALGDPKQCTAVEAGAIIDLSRHVLGAEQVPVILTTKRQQVEREREIVGLLRDGRAAEALSMKRSDGTAELAFGGREGVIARVAQIYAERLRETGTAPGINAPTNADAHDLSAAVRLERRKLGQVGPDLITLRATDGERDYALPLAAGDRVRLFKSTGARFDGGRGGSIGRNGSVLEVVGHNDAGLVLRGKSGKVGTVAWGDLEAPNGRTRLAYGDAMTIHTSQGSSTVTQITALPSGAQALNTGMGYSALTRHFSKSMLVTSDSAEHTAVRTSRPINDPHDITPDDKWAAVAKVLAHQPERDSATALRERVGQLKRGAVKGFQRAMAPSSSPRQASQVVQQKGFAADLARLRTIVQDQARATYRAAGRGIGL